MTEEQLQEIEARAAAATAGPWVVEGGSPLMVGSIGKPWIDEFSGEAQPSFVCNAGSGNDSQPLHFLQRYCDPEQQALANAAFIAHAREDIPALTKKVRRQQAENEKLLKALRSIE